MKTAIFCFLAIFPSITSADQTCRYDLGTNPVNGKSYELPKGIGSFVPLDFDDGEQTLVLSLVAKKAKVKARRITLRPGDLVVYPEFVLYWGYGQDKEGFRYVIVFVRVKCECNSR